MSERSWLTGKAARGYLKTIMPVALFIPCVVQDVLPEIGEAAFALLHRVSGPPDCPDLTCCGQPEYKLGRPDKARPLARRLLDAFESAERVVCPSGSCVSMIRHYPELFAEGSADHRRAVALAAKTFELCQYLVDVAGVLDFGARLDARACWHDSCQVGRALGVVEQPRALLARVAGLAMVELDQPAKCCGFGGAFSIQFPEISEAIVAEKADDIERQGVDLVISAEPSCLMNIGGYLDKSHSRVRAVHIAQVLAGMAGPDGSGA